MIIGVPREIKTNEYRELTGGQEFEAVEIGKDNQRLADFVLVEKRREFTQAVITARLTLGEMILGWKQLLLRGDQKETPIFQI
jgi:hypothetical protein